MNSLESLQSFESKAEDAKQAKTSGSSQELGKDDFLRLLVSQLENQDPLNPSDPTEFTAQLAQYSSLEQMTNINENIEDLGGAKDEIGRMSALSLIDRRVTAETDTLRFEGQPVEIGFKFDDPAESASVTIRDENGSVVDTRKINDPQDGNNFLQWDGTDSDGGRLPEGEYMIEAVGLDADGDEIQGTTMAETMVTGADFSGSGNTVLTAGGPLELSEVVKVNNSTYEAESGQ